MNTKYVDGLQLLIGDKACDVLMMRINPVNTESELLISDDSSLQWCETKQAPAQLADGAQAICKVHTFSNRDDRDLARGLDLSSRPAFDVVAIVERGADTTIGILENGRIILRDRRDVAVKE